MAAPQRPGTGASIKTATQIILIYFNYGLIFTKSIINNPGANMRLDRIDLNLFVVFDALYRERGVTRVAQQLHLTQPAVSNALSRLRQTFDDQLFVRTPQGMQPTPVADNVIGDVRRALGLLGKSVGVNARFDPATSEKAFRLGLNDLGQWLLLPTLQQRVRRAAPRVSLSTYYQDRHSAAEALKASDLDLLVDAPQVNAREFHHRPLVTMPYVVAMRPDHPLAHGTLSLERYLEAAHIHVSSRRRGRGHADIALHTLGEKREVAMRVQHYLVAEQITRHSDLLWTVPRILAERLSLTFRDTPFALEPMRWHLYWSRSAADDPANRWLRDRVAESLAAVMGDAETPGAD